MEGMPDSSVPADPRVASDLLPTFDRLAGELATSVLRLDGRKVVSWDEFTAGACATLERHIADKVFRAAALLVRSRQADLSTVFDIVAAGQLPELAEQLMNDVVAGKSAAREFAGPMQALLTGAAVRSGVAKWRHSWSGWPLLVGPHGEALDLAEVAALSCDPVTLPAARARLTAMGIDISLGPATHEATAAQTAEIMGGLANVKIDSVPHDVFIMGDGLILVPCPKSSVGGKERMAALIDSTPPVELAAQHRFLPYESIATAAIRSAAPIRARLSLRGGGGIRIQEEWTSNQLTLESRDLLNRALLSLQRTATSD
jgi:hypothetical protein